MLPKTPNCKTLPKTVHCKTMPKTKHYCKTLPRILHCKTLPKTLPKTKHFQKTLLQNTTQNTHLQPLFRLQKKALRIIINSPPRAHTYSLLNTLKILNIFNPYHADIQIRKQSLKLAFFQSKHDYETNKMFISGVSSLVQQYHTPYISN